MAEISGTPDDDVNLDGTGAADRIRGLAGNDVIRGLAGNDVLSGDADDDTLLGGLGNDTLGGGPGRDRLFGEAGNDRLRGGAGGDQLDGGAGRDRLFGEAGGDRLDGLANDDVLNGGLGTDLLRGGAGDDQLLGGAGRDALRGGAGDDVLNGGPDEDSLTGGPGADAFAIGNVRHGVDTVTDFDGAQDRLDLSFALPDFDPGDDAADYVRFRGVGDDTVVALDPTGGGGPFTDALLLRGVTVDALPLDRLGLPEAVPVTDPFPEPITAGDIVAELVPVAQAPATRPPELGGDVALTRINGLYHADDGSGRLFTNDTRGPMYAIEPNGDLRQIFDLRQVVGDDFLGENDFWDGFRNFAFHPNFENPGAAGFGRLYIGYTATLASAADHPDTPVFDLNRPGAEVRHHDVLAEVRLNPETLRLVPDSYREIMRIEQPFFDHNIGYLGFNPNAEPGDPDYGKLYVGIPDGGAPPTNIDAADPLDQAQDTTTLLGSIIRVDPLPSGGEPYGVPDDNPFVGRPGVLPEIWTYGFREPQFFSWDPGGDGKMLIADIGHRNAEEVNLGLPGRNYGWSQREGTFVTDEDDPLVLYQLPPNEVRNFTYPVAQYDHDEGRGIVGGFVYRGDAVPELQGKYVFGDIVNGRIFYTDVDELELGRQAEIQELRLTVGGQETGFLQFLNATSGAQRADLRFGQGEDGEIYILSKQDGSIRTLQSADGGPAQAASSHDALTLDDVLGGGGEAGGGAPVAATTAASLPPVGGYDGSPVDDLLIATGPAGTSV